MAHPIKEEDAKFFAKFGKNITFRKGEIILRPDENPSSIYYIEKGLVRLYSISSSGQEITFNVFKPGSYLFMMWALSEVENRYFFETITEVKALRVSKEKVIEFLKTQPDLLYKLNKRTMIALEAIVSTTLMLLSGNARSKIATVFVMLTQRFGVKGKNNHVIIRAPLTHRLIATFAGLTRETASLEIEKLQKAKTISRKRHFFVVNKMKKLESDLEIAESEIPV